MSDPVEQFLSRLQHPVMAGIDLKLDRQLRLLSLLGSPHKRLPPVVHVAGTNGKGSLLACLHSILETAGYRVHRYTSPHLVRFSERIVVQGKPIEQARMMNILQYVAPVLQTQPATFFEATTAAAFLAFAETPADVLLLETGMGGRLDATNVVDKPVLTAITPVSFDHMQFLGNKLSSIAAEKAGIIKHGVPCVIGRQPKEALLVIEKAAGALAAPLFRLGCEWEVVEKQGHYHYHSPKRSVMLKPALAGRFQYDNAATAVACLDALPQFTVSDGQIATGLARTTWPARLQRLTNGRLREILPQEAQLWLDGGHNAQGGEVLAEFLALCPGPVYLVCGMVGDKDSAAYLAPLAPVAHELYAVEIPDEPMGKKPQQLEMAARSLGIVSHTAASLEKALQTIASHARTPDVNSAYTVCICGSLYLAGKVLAANQSQESP